MRDDTKEAGWARKPVRRWASAWTAGAVVALSAACGGDAAAPPEPPGRISVDFEGAALEGWTPTDGGFDLDLAASPAGAARWYSFRLHGREGRPTSFRIVDAQAAAWEGAWAFDRPVVSSDGGRSWRRIRETVYTGFFFHFEYTPASAEEWIAWVPPYGFSRWRALFAELREHPRVVEASTVGRSLEGRAVHHLVITDPDASDPARPGVWIVARQHPAETPSSWMLEGLLDWVLGGTAEAGALLRAVEIHVAPFLNPDGVVRGHYRVNTGGLDLNRVWDDPDPATAPTVAAARELLEGWVEAGRDLRLFVDLHGDPGGRKNFLYYNEHEEGPRREVVELLRALETETPLFSAEGSGPFTGLARVAQIWVETTLGAPAVTMEASFQDIGHGPEAGRYMEVADYRELGAALGRALARTLLADGSAGT